LPPVIEQMKKRLADLTADQATSTAHARDAITVGKRPRAEDEADLREEYVTYFQELKQVVAQASTGGMGLLAMLS